VVRSITLKRDINKSQGFEKQNWCSINNMKLWNIKHVVGLGYMVYTGNTGLPVLLRYQGKNKMIHWVGEKFNPDTTGYLPGTLQDSVINLVSDSKLMVLQEKSSFAGMEY
jgi:hypothetical protein